MMALAKPKLMAASIKLRKLALLFFFSVIYRLLIVNEISFTVDLVIKRLVYALEKVCDYRLGKQ